MKIDIQAISDKGRVRENNEDALSIGGVFLRDDAMNLTVDVQENAVFYLLVSDGMGGHEKGEEASEITLSELKEQFAMNEIRPDTFSDDIDEAGKYISFKLNNAASEQGQAKPMGCTLTGVVWHYGKIYLTDRGIWVARQVDQELNAILAHFPPVSQPLTQEEQFAAALAMTSALPDRIFTGEYDRLLGPDPAEKEDRP